MEAQVESLENKYDELLDKPEMANLKKQVSELEKLEYQKEQLETAIVETTKTMSSNLICIIDSLSATFDWAIKKAFPMLMGHTVALTASTNPKFGDYQCNSALILGKQLLPYNIKLERKEVADKICQCLSLKPLMEKVEVVGSGFINIYLSTDFVASELRKLITFGVKLQPPALKKRFIVDMSSPNIAKQMHVGHLRSTIIGDGISRFLEFVGYDVLKLNHLGDWGTQFGMLIAHLHDTFPNLGDEPLPIADLEAFYKASKKRFDEDEDFKKRAYAAVVKLQAHDAKYISEWERICNISRQDFEYIYRQLDIKNLVERGESFYQDRMHDVIKDLDSRGLLVTEEGRKLLWAPNSEVPLTVVKSDGGFTYDTSDLAAIRNRVEEEAADGIFYVVDAGQSIHFNTIFSAAEKIKYIDRSRHRVEHIAFGLVLNDDRKKFKTRSGETVRLRDLLSEGVERCAKKLEEKGRDKELTPEELTAAKEAIAYGCIKYADLSHNRTHDYVFSFDKMLDDRGNTAAYLLYAYTRIRSITRKAGLTEQQLATMRTSAPLKLEHPSEFRLAKTLCRMSEILKKIEEDLLLHRLCDYIYEVSSVFTDFYDTCYCIERDPATGKVVKINDWRMMLCEATATVMKCGFDIIGLRTVEKM